MQQRYQKRCILNVNLLSSSCTSPLLCQRMHFNVFKHLRELQTLTSSTKCLIIRAVLCDCGLDCGLKDSRSLGRSCLALMARAWPVLVNPESCPGRLTDTWRLSRSNPSLVWCLLSSQHRSSEANAGPSTPLGAKNAPNFAQDDSSFTIKFGDRTS